MKLYSLFLFFLVSGLNNISICFSMEPDSLREKSSRNISLGYFHGVLVPHHPVITYFNNEYINGFDLMVSRYVSETQHPNPPEMGAGYYFSNLGSKEIYGYAHALYFFISRDFLKNSPNLCLRSSISIGASYNTLHWDITDNYSNRSIGSNMNILFRYSLQLKVKISEKMLVSAGPALVHTSNGNIKQPNLGLNLITTNFSLIYQPDQKSPRRPAEVKTLPDINKNRYIFILSGGFRQLSHRIPDYYGAGSLSSGYSRMVTPYLALGAGTDIIYDPTEGKEIYVTGSHVENIVPWHMGVHLSFERIWNNLSLVANYGYKIVTPSEHFNHQYNRIGIRYRFGNHFVVNYTLKSHRFVADFAEFGAGYIID